MKKVENFRLSKDQLSWMKEAKKINRIESILAKGVLQEWFKKGESLKRVFSQLGEKRKMLSLVSPEEPVDEIPGQGTEERDRAAELFDRGEGEGEGGISGASEGTFGGMGINQGLVR